jgi:MFS family permease
MLPAISKELHLSSVNAGVLSTCTLIAMGLGGALAGWLADRIGRVRVVSWSVLIFSAFTSLIVLYHTYSQIAFLRFISGFGIPFAPHIPAQQLLRFLGLHFRGAGVRQPSGAQFRVHPPLNRR